MKNLALPVVALFLFAFCPVRLFSQLDLLEQRLQGKQKFEEINLTVEQFLSELPDSYEKQRLAKRYARWAWFWSSHLGPEGEFVNVSRKTLDVSRAMTDLPQTSANGNWTFAGPSGSIVSTPGAIYNGLGRVDRIAFHPSNSNIIYIGTTAGGLWKTTDAGLTWSPLSDFLASLGISGIVVDHSNPNTIFVLTGDGDSYKPATFVYDAGYIRKSVGVLVSTDGGINWEETGVMSTADYVGFQLRQHPTNANILIAATSDGIFRTTDHGDTWVRERTGKHYDIEFKPGTPATVYATAQGAFVYSTNTGDTWNTDATFDYPLCTGGRVEIAVTNATGAANKVFLLAGPVGASNSFCGFYVSTNSGSSFTRKCNTPNILGTETGGGGDQSDYDMALAVHPTNDQIIIAGGLVTYKSNDGGSVFTYLSTYNENGGKYIHPDIHMVAYNPLNNYLWVTGDGGVHRSTNDGGVWTDLYSGICVTQFYHMADYDGNANAILAGSQDNGVKYRTTATPGFSHILGGDGFDGIIDYTDQTKGYVVVNDLLAKFENFASTAPSLVRDGGFFMQVEMNSSNHNIIYIGDGNVFSYNASTGATTQMSTTAMGHWALKTCPSNSQRIYSAGGWGGAFSPVGSLYTYNGTNWDILSGNPGFPATFPRITDIGVNPSNSSEVCVCFGGYTTDVKVVSSTDAGQNWTNISFDLPNLPVNAIEVDNGNNIYVGCDIGVYYKANGSTHWEPFSNNLPQTPVSDLEINIAADQMMAATFGRGIWKSPLYEACPSNVNISTNISGPYFSKASNSITISGQVTGGTETDVRLRSEGYVDLTPGFRADATPGNLFRAYIGVCAIPFPSSLAPDAISIDSALSGYQMNFSRAKGTLEVFRNMAQQQVRIRLYESGKVRVLLCDPFGILVREVISFEGQTGERMADIFTADLKPGVYQLFLTVNDRVEHLQELEIR